MGLLGCPARLAQINLHTFDVLISDLNIGYPADGFVVVSAMRRTQPITFILTGNPAFGSALRAIQAHVDNYFFKPADIETLVARVRDRLSNRRPVRQNRQ
jgi:DNA-binding response OmpR family regulator